MRHNKVMAGGQPIRPLQRTKSAPSEVSLIVKYLLFALNVLFWVSDISINTLFKNRRVVKK